MLKKLTHVFITLCAYNAIYAAPVDRIKVLNDFRVIMKGVNVVQTYLDKLAEITLPIVGDPYAQPPIEGEISKQQKAVKASFEPILDRLDVLSKIENEQPWLLELACLEGGRQIRQDVHDIKDIVDANLQTLNKSFTDIHNLATSAQITRLKTIVDTNEPIKSAMMLIGQEHLAAQQSAQQTGALSATGLSQTQEQPVEYTRILSLRNTGDVGLTLTQLNIQGGKDLFGKAVQDSTTTITQNLAPQTILTLKKVSTGPIDFEFNFNGKKVTAQVPSAEARHATMIKMGFVSQPFNHFNVQKTCIDVSPNGAKIVSCAFQEITYNRKLVIKNNGKTTVRLLQVHIPPGMNNMFNMKLSPPAPGQQPMTTSDFGKIDAGKAFMWDNVSTGPIDIQVEFKGGLPLEPMTIPAEAGPTCIVIDENGAGKCAQP